MRKPRRRWFSYSLRTFFVLLTMFGVWLGVQVKWIRDRREFVRKHAFVLEVREVDVFEGGVDAPWSIRILGEPGHGLIWVWEDFQNFKNIERQARGLFPEASVERRTDAIEPKS